MTLRVLEKLCAEVRKRTVGWMRILQTIETLLHNCGSPSGAVWGNLGTTRAAGASASPKIPIGCIAPDHLAVEAGSLEVQSNTNYK
jgi:hypothetical protein